MPEDKEPPKDDDQEQKAPEDEVAKQRAKKEAEEQKDNRDVDDLIRGLSGPIPNADDLIKALQEDPEIQRMQAEERTRKAAIERGELPPTPIKRPENPTPTEPPQPPQKPKGSDNGNPSGGGTPSGGI